MTISYTVSENIKPKMKKNNKKPTNKKSEKKQLQIIGQGTYGCVFRPEINCRTQQSGSKDYLSKIQMADNISSAEIELGKIIQTIPNYRFFFAPILSYCDINLSTIDQRQIEKCDMVKDALKEHHNPKFISNKIQYAGKNTLGTYFHELLVNKCANGGDNPLNCVSTNSKKKKNSINIYLSKIVESHLYLLNSIQLLNDKGIMHLDLKENNVMHDDDNDIFILIDYGLSAQNKLLEPATYEKTATKSFGVLTTDPYSPWCIEVVMMSYIARQIKLDKLSTDKNASIVDPAKFQEKITNVHVDEMKKYCTLHVTKNDILQLRIITQGERNDYEKRLHKWVTSFKGKSWKEVWTTILESHKSWDNYGIAVIFLYEFLDTGILDLIIHHNNSDNAKIISNTNDDKPIQNKPAKNIWNTISEVVTNATAEQRKEFHFLIDYVSLMKNMLIAEPLTMKTATETSKEIKTIFKKLNKLNYTNVVKILNTKILTHKNIKTAKENKLRRTLYDLKTEKELTEIIRDKK